MTNTFSPEGISRDDIAESQIMSFNSATGVPYDPTQQPSNALSSVDPSALSPFKLG